MLQESNQINSAPSKGYTVMDMQLIIEERLGDLERSLGIIEDRIQAVLSKEPSKNNAGEAIVPRQPCLCPLADILQTQANKLEFSIKWLNNIIERVQL